MVSSGERCMTDFDHRIDRLPPEKRAVLEQRLLGRRSAAPKPGEAIQKRKPDDPRPLSFAQQRLWFFDQWDPGSPLYNAALWIEITGPLNIERLQTAFNTILWRHEVLRTNYTTENGVPVQNVAAYLPMELRAVPLWKLSKPERRPAAARLAAQE